MVTEEKLLEWVQEKLKQGVDEQRIRKSLKETGHDPALVEKAKDPFNGSEADKQPQEDQMSDELGDEIDRPDDKQQEPENKRNREPAEKKKQPENEQEPSQDTERRGKEESSREPSLDREMSQSNDQSSDNSGREPSIDLSKNSQTQNTNERNSQTGNNRNQNREPQPPRQTNQRRRPPENQGSNDDSGFSLPSFSMPSVDLSMPSVPWKTVGAVVLLLVIAGGGFTAYQSGMFSGLQAPDIPINNDQSSPDSNTENTGTQSEPVCPDVGVRISNAEISGSSTNVKVKLFGGQITGLVELYDGNSVVASETFEISNTKSLSFSQTGDRVVFRPDGCNSIKDSYRLN